MPATATATALQALNEACDVIETIEWALADARAKGQDLAYIQQLQDRHAEESANMFQLWDAWNEEMSKARLAMLN